MRRISGWLLASGIIACLAGSAWAADEAIMNDTLKTIFSRKSVRTFKSEPVPKEKLDCSSGPAWRRPRQWTRGPGSSSS